MFIQITKFSIMVDTTCLGLTLSLLSMSLILDIGLISGIAYELCTEPFESRTSHKDGLLVYALLIFTLIALGLIIAILMLTTLLIKERNHTVSPNINLLEQKGPDFEINRIRRRHSSYCFLRQMNF